MLLPKCWKSEFGSNLWRSERRSNQLSHELYLYYRIVHRWQRKNKLSLCLNLSWYITTIFCSNSQPIRLRNGKLAEHISGANPLNWDTRSRCRRMVGQSRYKAIPQIRWPKTRWTFSPCTRKRSGIWKVYEK